MFNVIAYGYSSKNDNPEMIGMYGNGLKSGSMRVGNDCLVLSIKDNELSALMISQTFIRSSHAGFENEHVSASFPFSARIYLFFSERSNLPLAELEDTIRERRVGQLSSHLRSIEARKRGKDATRDRSRSYHKLLTILQRGNSSW